MCVFHIQPIIKTYTLYHARNYLSNFDAMISPDSVEKVRDLADIVDIIGEFIT